MVATDLAQVVSVQVSTVQIPNSISFTATLLAQNSITYASMDWPNSYVDLLESDFEFSDGVKIDSVTGLLVIPANVTRFSIFRKIKDEDTEEFFLNPILLLNGVAISDPEPIIEDGSVSEPLAAPRISRLTAARSRVLEGEKVVVFATISNPQNTATQFSLSLTGKGTSDVALKMNWEFTNGVKWSTDRSKIIVPAGVRSFQVSFYAKYDNFGESFENIRLQIDRLATNLTIQDTPAAAVLALSVPVLVPESATLTATVKVRAKTFFTAAGITLTGQTSDIDARRLWKFSHGVRWNYDMSRVIIPPLVSQFNIAIGTSSDKTKENERIRLNVGGQVRDVTINDVEFAPVSSISRFQLANDQYLRYVNLVSEGSQIKFRVKFKNYVMGGSFFKLNLLGNAFRSFNWSFRGEEISVKDFGGGILKVGNHVDKEIGLVVIATIGQDKYFNGRQTAIFGSFESTVRSAITIECNVGVTTVFNNLPIARNAGHLLLAKTLARQLKAIRTPANIPVLNLRMADHGYLVDPALRPLFDMDKRQTIGSFISRVQQSTANVRSDNLNSAQFALSLAYADLVSPAFVSGRYRSTVLENALTYLRQVNTRLESSLSKAMKVRITFADILASADVTDPKDREWISAGTLPKYAAISAMWAEYLKKFNTFTDDVCATFDQIRRSYAEAEDQTANLVNAIVTAALTGLSVIGSVGFFVANFRAAWNQVNSFLGNSALSSLTFSSILQHSINAPAVFGSITLLVNNAAHMIMHSITSSKIGTAGFGQFSGPLSEFKTNYEEENSALLARLQKFEAAYLDMLHYVLREGGAGDSDVFIREEWNGYSQTRPWQNRTGFINEPGYVYAWATQPIPHKTPLGGITYKQQIWGIPIPTDGSPDPRNVKVQSPIALDLLGDGLDFTPLSQRALFDADHDGRRDRIAWIGEGTALLAYDGDGDGAVTRTDEISFTGYKEGAQTDLEGLTAFDSNGDMVFDAHDALWHRFGVWQDKNQDGVTQRGEFVSLTQSGIASISLVSDKIASAVGDVLIYGRSSFTRIDGTTGTVGDVGFRYANA